MWTTVKTLFNVKDTNNIAVIWKQIIQEQPAKRWKIAVYLVFFKGNSSFFNDKVSFVKLSRTQCWQWVKYCDTNNNTEQLMRSFEVSHGFFPHCTVCQIYLIWIMRNCNETTAAHCCKRLALLINVFICIFPALINEIWTIFPVHASNF